MPSPQTTPRRRSLLGGALAAVLTVTLAGCGVFGDDGSQTLPAPTLSPSPMSTAPGRTPSPAGALDRFYAQRLDWRDCRDGDRCATLTVPLDYAQPGGKTIELALLKVPAGTDSQRVGSLVVNPGGPGGSGVDYAAQASAYFGPELLQAFDIVGFDPRGVGRSTPVQCLSDAKLDAFVAADPDPDTPAEIRRGDRLLAELGEGCLRESGKLAAHVSTVEAAKDIDILRGALGEPRLTYFGASYGTFLGATYAGLFPENVGRMVLDGAIDPAVTTEETSLVQARGFETALRAYVGHCVELGDCFLGDTVDAGTERIREFLDQVEARPMQGSGGRQLTVGNAVLGIWAPLYNAANWPVLDTALQRGFTGDGSVLLALSDRYTSRGPEGYVDNSLEALYAVNCLDHDDAIPAAQVPAHIPEFERASPTFGAIFAFGLSTCSHWPVHTGREPAPIHAPGAAPILVVGTTRDPATPMEWAVSLARQLDSGVLVRRDGDGHTGYHAGNACVDHTVEAYLVSGTVPKGTVSC